MMPARPVRFHSRLESGSLRVSVTSWPSAVIDSTFARRAESRHEGLSLRVCSDHTTSSGVSACPSWKVTPSRTVKVYSRPSSEIVQSLASAGTMSCSGVRETRP